MTDTILSPSEYIESRFREYFRDAADVTVDIDNEFETIHVHVTLPTDTADHFRLRSWVCEIGSDDDWYVFTDSTGSIITLPLMADALEL